MMEQKPDWRRHKKHQAVEKKGRRERLDPKERDREVPNLFPNDEVHLAVDEITFYANHRPYCFAVDRQSTHKALKDREFTGLQRRVEAIQTEAKHSLRLYLPDAAYRDERGPDDLPYLFDPRFWYVDGTSKRATGYAANPHARPHLWNAYLRAVALSREGVGPEAIVFGEATRFFRDEQWLSMFARAIWGAGIKLYVCNFGEVTKHTLPGLIALINALSGWLPMVVKGAKEARKSRGQIFHNQPPFGLRFDASRSEVWTDTEEWPILMAILDHVDQGTFTTRSQVVSWLRETYNIHRSETWLTKLLSSPILFGEYTVDRHQFLPRTISQIGSGSVLKDLDITPGGNRRYLCEPTTPRKFPVRETEGTALPPEPLVRRVQKRILSHVGRPRKAIGEGLGDSLFYPRMLRCAVCGSSISELAPGTTSPKAKCWALRCNCVSTIRSRRKITTEEAKRDPLCQHVTYVRASLSLPAWRLLTETIEKHPLVPEASRDPWAEEHEAERKWKAAQDALDLFLGRCAAGEVGDQSDPHIRAWVDRERAKLLKALTEAEQEHERLAGDQLTHRNNDVALRDLQEVLRHFHAEALAVAEKRQLMLDLVEEVKVNLETGGFEMRIDTSVPSLARLCGQTLGENETGLWWSSVFTFPLTGTIDRAA